MAQAHSDNAQGGPDLRSFSEEGFATLVSVLLVGAVASAIAVSLLLGGVRSAKSGIILTQLVQARALATACAEVTLQSLHDNLSYSGTVALTLGEGTCSATLTVGTGTLRTITSSGTVGTVVQKMTVQTSALTPRITLSSWQDVGDF